MTYRGQIAVCLVICLVTPTAAQDSDAVALFRAAAEHETKDPAGAVRLYGQAANQGHTPSMVRLGYLLQSGAGVTEDQPRAFALYTQAAKAGSLDGEFMLAMSYAQGIGTPRDPVAARKWFLPAAAAGHQFAQYHLGIMLAGGEGGPRKIAAARRWLDRAATGPDAAVAERSSDLRDKIDQELLAMDTSGTTIVVAILVLALMGKAMGAEDASGGPSSPGMPGGSGPGPSPPIHCHPEPLFGSGTLNGRDAVNLSLQTHIVCD